MTSALLVEPLSFGPNPLTKDNPLIQSLKVSNAKAEMDKAQACSVVAGISSLLSSDCGISTCVVRQSQEPKALRTVLEEKGESICIAHSLSFHDIIDDAGTIDRRIIVFYPMSPLRRAELANSQIVSAITRVADTNDMVELIDLRPFEGDSKYLEGTGSLVFSTTCRFVYMLHSARSHPDVLDVLCSPENLNIPVKNRFLFHCNLPGRVIDMLPHTSVLGWCGNGICAWALSSIYFDTEEEQQAFYEHLAQEYRCVLDLSPNELYGFSGNALEVPQWVAGADEPTMCLMISDSAFAALTAENRKKLVDWYGGRNIRTLYGEVVERRCGTSLQSCVALSYTMGSVPIDPKETPTVEYLQLHQNRAK